MSYTINRTKHLIHKIYSRSISRYKPSSFSNFTSIYLGTNENLEGYLGDLQFSQNNRALSVLASGDQVFSLISKGALNIDTFDTNILTEYYVLGLKKALILCYGYEDYIKVFKYLTSPTISLLEFNTIILHLTTYMEDKYREFWRNIINYNYELQKDGQHRNLLRMLAKENPSLELSQISYLKNEERYNNLKRNLENANITYANIDALKLHKKLKNKKAYDCVVLSNILDYAYLTYADDWFYEKLQNFEEQLLPYVADGGQIFLNYIFDYEKGERLISHSYIKENNLCGEQLKSFESTFRYPSKDAVLVYRKK